MQNVNDLIPHLKKPLSIIIIGCGGIVNDAHLPAYKMAGYSVEGVFDEDHVRAKKTAGKFEIKHCFKNREDVCAHWRENMVFDIAVPAVNIQEILEWLPEKSAVLIQKPFGADLNAARNLLKICRSKQLRAAINFQLRYSPPILKAKQLIEKGALGAIRDVEVRVTCHTPWSLWPFLYDIPRMEILYHSIHYIDLIRSICGQPACVYAKTLASPEQERIKNCRSTIIMDYGDVTRANIETNHLHNFGRERQESFFKCEGTKGAIVANLGVNLDYPRGEPDYLKYYDLASPDSGWQEIPIAGNWFPHAFIGSMGSVLLAEAGQIKQPSTHVEDAFQTMAVVEAAYDSSTRGGISLNDYIA